MTSDTEKLSVELETDDTERTVYDLLSVLDSPEVVDWTMTKVEDEG